MKFLCKNCGKNILNFKGGCHGINRCDCPNHEKWRPRVKKNIPWCNPCPFYIPNLPKEEIIAIDRYMSGVGIYCTKPYYGLCFQRSPYMKEPHGVDQDLPTRIPR